MTGGIPPNSIINKNLYLFLYNLLKNIFLIDKSNEIKSNLHKWINVINKEMIINSSKFLNMDYSKNNLRNILNFIKTQNKKYAGEILEELLILIFNIPFRIEENKTFNKYLCEDLAKFIEYNFEQNFILNYFKENPLKDLKQNFSSDIFKSSPLLNILCDIFTEKYLNIDKVDNDNKFTFYIYKNAFNISNITKNIFDCFDKNNFNYKINNNNLDDAFMFDELYFERNKNNVIKEMAFNNKINIIKSFFISVYIFHQNRNSVNLSQLNKSELSEVPLKFDIVNFTIKDKNSYFIFSPLRIESNISILKLGKNSINEIGFLELSKIFTFNKSIKIVNLNMTLINSDHLKYLIYGFGIYNNNNVEELNFSLNYLDENCEEYLIQIISRFKELKTLYLSSNIIKDGFAFLFNSLKRLYREKKTKLEKLIIEKNDMKNTAYYELGELIKSKYCKLKVLNLNSNVIPINSNFLKKLKKNKNLEKLFLSKCKICEKDKDEIMRGISNSNIKHFYLYDNNNFELLDNILRIIYRTKLVKSKEEINMNNHYIEESALMNLDISNVKSYNINLQKLILIKNIINNTNLYCLDMSHIIYGKIIPEKTKIKNKKYIDYVNSIKKELIEKQNIYRKKMKQIKDNEVNIKNSEKLKF